MTRLTNEIRNEICEKAIEESFAKKKAALKKEEAKLGMKLYKSVFKPSELAKLDSLDEKWIVRDRCLRFNCQGYDLRFNIADKEEDGVPVPVSKRDYGCRSLGNITGEIAMEAQAFANKKQDASKEEDRARRALMAVLHSVSTVKRLAEVWPEGAKFYNIYLAEVEKTGVPAIKMQELNAMLGLKDAA